MINYGYNADQRFILLTLAEIMTYICFIIQYFRPPKVRLRSNNLRNPMQDIISNFFCVEQHSLFVSSSYGPPAIWTTEKGTAARQTRPRK